MPGDGLNIGDAFGAVLNDNFERNPHGMRSHVIERDDGFIDTADTGQYFAAPEAWNALDRWALETVSGRVLDIGAGAGRHSLYLRERGCDAVALDVSPRAADLCAKRGVRDTFAGTIEQYAATAPAPFDAFVLLGNNLGLFRDAEYAPRFLALLAEMRARER
jgi:SAM-dependent methyltransferase